MKDLTGAVLVLIICLLVGVLFRTCRQGQQQQKQWEAVTDTLTKQLDRKGREVSTIRVLSGSRQQAIKKLKRANDSLSLELAEAIRTAGRRVRTVTVVENHTDIDTFLNTVVRWDTLEKLDTFYLWPVYDSYLKDRWIDIKISARHDTTHTEIGVKNDFIVTHRQTRKGLTVSVTDGSPYTSTEDIKSFAIKPKRRRLGIGIHAGAGIDPTGRIVPNIGLSASFHFLQL